ncbi:hypothetical protein HWV62_37259 [Athelia sp. TMB]|nr:hypothetical protein HWV62_37259 [Athelia sp. TMB]
MRPYTSSFRPVARQVAGRRFASTSTETAQKKAQDALGGAQKSAEQLWASAKKLLGPVGEKAGNMLGSYRDPLVYNVKVTRELLKQVYLAERLQPPTSLSTIQSAYKTIWTRASNPAYWREAAKTGELAKVGVYAVEAYGIFKRDSMDSPSLYLKSESQEDLLEDINALDAPPSLNYSLRNRKTAIAITWTVICIDSCIMPVVLFYSLWFGSNLSHERIFSIMTTVFGLPTMFNFLRRMWGLCKKDPSRRPIGSRRGWLDFFQINFALIFALVTSQLILGTVTPEPILPLLSMPHSTVLLLVGSQLIATHFMTLFSLRIPFRISSLPRGSIARPSIYTIIEDIVGVDGGGRLDFRERLNARYEASPVFRRMLFRLNAFWGFGGVGLAAILVAIVWTVPGTVAFGIGWITPIIWACIWAFLTIRYVKASLVEEYATWHLISTPNARYFV